MRSGRGDPPDSSSTLRGETSSWSSGSTTPSELTRHATRSDASRLRRTESTAFEHEDELNLTRELT
jgi:hypothetical protein